MTSITLDASRCARHVAVGSKGTVYAWIGPARGPLTIAAGRIKVGDEIECTPLIGSKSMRTCMLRGPLAALGEVAGVGPDGLVTFLEGATARTERIAREKPHRPLRGVEQVGDMLVVVGDGGQVFVRTPTEPWRLLGGVPLRASKSRVVLHGAASWRGTGRERRSPRERWLRHELRDRVLAGLRQPRVEVEHVRAKRVNGREGSRGGGRGGLEERDGRGDHRLRGQHLVGEPRVAERTPEGAAVLLAITAALSIAAEQARPTTSARTGSCSC